MLIFYIEYKQRLDNSTSIKRLIDHQQKLEIVEIPPAEIDAVYHAILSGINFHNFSVSSCSSPPLAMPEPNPVKKFITKRSAATCRYRYYRLTSDIARRTVIFEWK